MRLHWSPKSPYVRKVMIAAHELGLADRITKVRTVAAMSAPNRELMADNPLAKIPTLVLADGRRLFDSLVICEYLDHLAGGGRLFPAPSDQRWQALTWHALASGLLDVLILWRNEREKPAERRTPAWLDGFALKVEAGLDQLEREVPNLETAPFGIGHIAIGCALAYLDYRFDALEWRTGRPALAGWAEAFEGRDSARQTVIVDG